MMASQSSVPTFTNGSIPFSSSSKSFLIVPAAPAPTSSNPKQTRPRPASTSFLVHRTIHPTPAAVVKPHPPIVDVSQLVSYKAPAHKHAHHLHSIPPREKTVKMQILDHMLWQHTRARFFQARLELGLPCHTPHNQTPVGPDGSGQCGAEDPRLLSPLDQDIRALKFGVRGLDRVKAYYEYADSRFVDLIDLDTARVQRDTAHGLEKVASSLLADANLHSSSSSASSAAPGSHTSRPPLPNKAQSPRLSHAVRVRVSLSALVNEFFARDDPTPAVPEPQIPHSEQQPERIIYNVVEDFYEEMEEDDHGPMGVLPSSTPSPMAISSLITPQNPPQGKAPSVNPHIDPPLPRSLSNITPLTSYALVPSSKSRSSSYGNSAAGGPSSARGRLSPSTRHLPPPNSIFSTIPRGAGLESPWALGSRIPGLHPTPSSTSGPSGSSSTGSRPPAPKVWKAIGRSRELYNIGVDVQRRRTPPRGSSSSKSPSPPPHPLDTILCPRHLTDIEICPGLCVYCARVASANASSFSDKRAILGVAPNGTTPIGAGLAMAGPPLRRHAVLPPNSTSYSSPSSSPTETSGGESSSPASSSLPNSASPTSSSSSSIRMLDLLPRFIRFSALVARELGAEARASGEQSELSSDPSSSSPLGHGASITSAPGTVTGPGIGGVVPSTTGDARPLRAWYALLCGIVTRAVLEGYIRGKWKGADPLEVLFGLGVGIKPGETPDTPKEELARRYSSTSHTGSATSAMDIDADFQQRLHQSIVPPPSSVNEAALEPDDMPSLSEAIQILFGRGLLPPPPRNSPKMGGERLASQLNIDDTGLHAYRPGGGPSTSSSAARAQASSAGIPHPQQTYGASTSHASSGLQGQGVNQLPWDPITTGAIARPGVGLGDPEWEAETSERLSEFAAVSLNSPDLLTHLQELSRRYPPEPVERVALRFFEAVAEWRGIPELEQYKMRARSAAHSGRPAAPATASTAIPMAMPPPPGPPASANAPSPSGSSTSSSSASTVSAPGSTSTPTNTNMNTQEVNKPSPASALFDFFVIPKHVVKIPPPTSPPASTHSSLPSSSFPTASKKRSAESLSLTSGGHSGKRVAKSPRSSASSSAGGAGMRWQSTGGNGDAVVEQAPVGWTGPYGL